jgi:quinoprotein glucose dehydrogenase
VDFGTDGTVLFSDWVEGWGKTGKGRIYKATAPAREGAKGAETARILREGFEKRGLEELAALLAYPDQRVRQEAQFELVSRGKASSAILVKVAEKHTNQLARLHAIWGLGQLLRAKLARFLS